MSPVFAETTDEHKDGDTGEGIFASREDRTASSLDGFHSQTLRGKELEMLRRHQSMWSGHLGEVSATEHRMDVEPGTRHSRQAPYRAGHSSRGLIKAEIERMLAQGVFEPATSKWASPVVIVPKDDDSARF